MNITLSENVRKKINIIKRQHPNVYIKINKQLKLFTSNPKHPSLRNHKLKGNLNNTWSISIEGNLRIVYYFTAIGVIFYDIGTHAQVYKS